MGIEWSSNDEEQLVPVAGSRTDLFQDCPKAFSFKTLYTRNGIHVLICLQVPVGMY